MYVLRMVGKRYGKRGQHFFSCHSSLSRWQQYEPIYVNVRAHYLLNLNYVVKKAAFVKTYGQGGQRIKVDIVALAREVTCKSPTLIWS